MAGWVPPYLNKQINKLEKELMVAETKELRAKADYEFAKEYKQLCEEKLKKAKENGTDKD